MRERKTEMVDKAMSVIILYLRDKVRQGEDWCFDVDQAWIIVYDQFLVSQIVYGNIINLVIQIF